MSFSFPDLGQLQGILEQLRFDAYYPQLNYFSAERLDLIILGLLKLLGRSNNQGLYVAFQLLIFFRGVFVLRRCLGENFINSALAGITAVLALTFFVGFDPFFLKIHWFPSLLLCFVLFFQGKGNLPFFIHSLIVSMLWSLSAGSLSLLGLIFAFAGGFLLAGRQTDQPEKSWMSSSYLVMTLLLCFVCSWYWMPEYSFSAYPEGARLAPYSPLTFGSRPLLGPELSINSISYSNLIKFSDLYFSRAVYLFLILSGIFLLLGKGMNRAWGWSLVFFVGILGTVYVEILVRDLPINSIIRNLTPFQSLLRLIPGFALEPLPWMLLVFGVIVGFSSLLLYADLNRLFLAFVLLISSTFVDYYHFIPYVKKLSRPYNHFYLERASRSEYWEKSVMLSPSSLLIKNEGDWTARYGVWEERKVANLKKYIPEQDFKYELSARPLNREAKLAIDGNVETRWRTAGPQVGGEFFVIKFDRVLKLIKINLELGESGRDFPRGLDVFGSIDGKQYFPIKSYKSWPGPVRWTEEGYPYYGRISEVEIDLPEEQEVTALKFVQTKSDSDFDWSINELEFYGFGEE